MLQSFKAHEGEIVKILFHPKGKNLVTIGTDNQIKLWSLDGQLLKNWQGHENINQSAIPLDPIKDVIFSPDGNKIVTIGGIDKQVKVWDLEGNLLKNWQTDDNLLTSINFSPDGQILATAGDKTVKLWNLEGKLLQTLSGHLANIASVSFSPDGKIIATASADQTVKLWYSHSGKILRTLHHHDNVYSVNFSPDRQILVSASADKITFWSLDGQLLHTLQGNQGNNILEVNFSSDGNIIASVDVKNNIILWNLDINDLQHRVHDWFSDYSS